MKNIAEFFKGNKTYLVAGCSVVYAVTGAITGHLSPNEAFQVAQTAVIGSAIHSAVVNNGSK